MAAIRIATAAPAGRAAADWGRLARHGYLLAVAGVGLAYAAGLVEGGMDVHAYWVMDRAAPYGSQAGVVDAFLYSPVAALVNVPFTFLPWPLYAAGLVVASMLALYRLAGPWSPLLLLWPAVALDLLMGNIHLLLAAGVALGIRYPAVWAFLLLTKVTPGVGVLWFAFRGEWRSFAIAVGLAGVLVAASLVLVPGWWPAWMDTLRASSETPVNLTVDIPIAYRLPFAVVAVWWGARRDNPAMVAVAAMLALPSLSGSYPVLLLASVVLWRDPRAPATSDNGWRPRTL